MTGAEKKRVRIAAVVLCVLSLCIFATVVASRVGRAAGLASALESDEAESLTQGFVLEECIDELPEGFELLRQSTEHGIAQLWYEGDASAAVNILDSRLVASGMYVLAAGEGKGYAGLVRSYERQGCAEGEKGNLFVCAQQVGDGASVLVSVY